MQKKIPFVEMPSGTTVDSAPPDGRYAVISYSGPYQQHREGFTVQNVFPWVTTIYAFAGGVGDLIAKGSSPPDMIGCHDILQVFLVGLNADMRAGLDQMLAKANIELVPAT